MQRQGRDVVDVPAPPPVYLGSGVRTSTFEAVDGGFVSIGDERFYRIANYDLMPPFFMSIVSASDHWMFISSNGALTAGRRNPENALFPYYTVDKIHDAHGITGGKALLLVQTGERVSLWEPFAEALRGLYNVQRHLYKNRSGNKLIFEEKNLDLDLTFRTMWTTSERFGFVRMSAIENVCARDVRVRVLDGVQNVLPYGVDRSLQTERSNLLDAYKKNELLAECGLGLFLLSSIPVDRPEPSEALSATTVWSVGLSEPSYLLSSRQLNRFREGAAIQTEVDVRAERGAYFVSSELSLSGHAAHSWYIVAEVNQGPGEVARLRNALTDVATLRQELTHDIDDGTNRLRKIVGAADGIQMSADESSTVRHFSNVLFNVMRGGTFANAYEIERKDLIDFVGTHNRRVLSSHRAFLENLPDTMHAETLLEIARTREDPDLSRLCHEYLPLAFSRRHGDPSRPWNYFSIDLKADDGTLLLNYEGNWRDIFQNWEALLVSFPGFTAGVISKFVNASTLDGYNPYRITRDGIDWEREDPADPWSFIGYWGDHQIIYLLKLLEMSKRFYPGQLERMLVSREFVFANVPYRIRPLENLLEDPHHTIDFDSDLEATIHDRVCALGADGRLVWNARGQVLRAGLLEKLLVSVLTKYSNFIPEGGIWMNTQRPEWNDANNALVGYGVSMVTLCYLRRFQRFMQELLQAVEWEKIEINEALAIFLEDVTEVFSSSRDLLERSLTNRERMRVLTGLGRAGGKYRASVYAPVPGDQTVTVPREKLLEFVELSLSWTDHTIAANRRGDGMYHSYNLLTVAGDELSIGHLYEMLEGQVAVLSSGFVSPRSSVEVLTALKNSRLFRSDQYSYLLYPDRRLARFDEKNRVPESVIAASPLLARFLSEGDCRIVSRDVDGIVHFNGSFRNRDDVNLALDRLRDEGLSEEIDTERQQILLLFEEVFDHRSYTGRSGTFFGYEGLGCIYWHMVSKLLLATAESHRSALREGADSAILGELVEHYYSIRAGIGLNKSPAVFGAFPTDPYSHTPANAGAKQPGMTGQVKEDILARWEELGVLVEDGCLSFSPSLLRSSEFLDEGATLEYFDVNDVHSTLHVAPGEMAFTYCQIPVVYRRASRRRLSVVHREGTTMVDGDLRLDRGTSQEIFRRSGQITSIEVEFTPAL